MTFPAVPIDSIPAVTTEQMIEVDRLMVDAYRIELIQMMENAGRSLARLAANRSLNADPGAHRVTVLAGRGGNGGGAIVAARRLHAWGAAVQIVISANEDDFSGVPHHQLDVASRIGIPICTGEASFDSSDLIIDGLIGYSLRGAPRGRAAELIDQANASQASVLSLDVPSGIDGGTGDIHEPSIRAAATMTLALPKTGLLRDEVQEQLGAFFLADISVPIELYQQMGLQVSGSLFAESDIVQLVS